MKLHDDPVERGGGQDETRSLLDALCVKSANVFTEGGLRHVLGEGEQDALAGNKKSERLECLDR